MPTRLTNIVFALASILYATASSAGQLVVVEARGVGLRPGATIDDSAPLRLQEGQHVVLIAANGSTVRVDGPNDRPPRATESGDPLQLALSALVTHSGARTTEVGVTRAPNAVVTLPEPWVLDVTRPGNVCLLQGEKPVFWRASAGAEAQLSVWPADRSWKGQATWTAGSATLDIPNAMPIHGGATYLVSFNGSTPAAVTIHLVPAVLANDRMRIAWMAHERCEAQAEALVRRIN